MNDVIIEHKRAISFNSNNYVLKVEDTFVPVQQSGAATYSNAFAVQYVASQRGSIELPAGAVDETETSSVILFPDAKSVQGNEFTVTRTFADNTLPKKNLESDLNPFIIAQYTAGADNRTEVHLPKKKATGKANAEQIGAEDDAYYINKDANIHSPSCCRPQPARKPHPVHSGKGNRTHRPGVSRFRQMGRVQWCHQ